VLYISCRAPNTINEGPTTRSAFLVQDLGAGPKMGGQKPFVGCRCKWRTIGVLLQVIRLRKKLSGAADAVKGLFGVGKSNDEVVEKLEKMQVCEYSLTIDLGLFFYVPA
jgi:hypothetical protein